MPETSQPTSSPSIALKSLSPNYDENHHGIYVAALTNALREPADFRNIAVTGAYGTGKSSVLKRLTELEEFADRVLPLSLSTVGMTEKRPEGESDTNPAAWTKTNLIQKEIVKQILYRDAPSRTRASRFRRISRFRWTSELGIALGLGLLSQAFLWITGLAPSFVGVLGKAPAFGWLVLAYGILLATLSGSVYAFRWFWNGRFFLEKFSAGPASVTLAATSSSYFDQYMDEIVYYFEQSGRDIVIFEDIDRFENVHIFEALRALNILLNGSEQVRRRRRTKASKSSGTPDVKFIYALRDSVFEKIGDEMANADEEAKRANRTKFFDVVIPIVPFITHRNARDLMLTAMKGTGVSRELVDVAARFVADMRLITDMRNEYDIYADRLLSAKTKMPGLNPDRLFALVLYKSVHMADFEAIRFGNSDLDKLYDAWRGIVKDSLADAYERDRSANRRLSLDSTSDARAKSLGDRIESVSFGLTWNDSYIATTHIAIDGAQYRAEDLRQPAFWVQITKPGASISVSNPRLGLNTSLTLEKLQLLMGQSLDPNDWMTFDRSDALRARQAARNDIRFLRHHEWREIYERSEFTTKPGTGDADWMIKATDRILQSRLARALVQAGYINEYFALYVSMYYGEHLHPRAINFVIHSLDRGVPDVEYVLNDEDVEAIIRDKGIDIFRDRAAYNISILDHLLSRHREEADLIIRQVAAWDRDDRDFADAFVQAGKEQVRFIQRLAVMSPTNIASVVTSAPEEMLAPLIEAALDYAGEQIVDNTASEFSSLVIENYKNFSSISALAQSESNVSLRKHLTLDAIAALGIQLPATAPLTESSREQAIKLGVYTLNATNIADLTKQPSLSLDAIRAESQAIFDAALRRVTEYLALVAEAPGAVTVTDPNSFVSILNQAYELGVDPRYMTQIVQLASDQCMVGNLEEVPEAQWPILAATNRFSPTARNVWLYFISIGELDEHVGKLLSGVPAIEESDSLAEAERVRLAAVVLTARDTIPSAKHRVELAVSLRLSLPISLSVLEPESGDLVGLMIEAGLVGDDEITFASTLIPDWPSREVALAKSKNAPTFLSSTSLPPAELSAFFLSTKLSELQSVAASRLANFIPGADREGVRAMATFAEATGTEVTFSTIDQLRVGGAADHVIASLLGYSTTSSIDEIRAELRALSDPYPLIADRGNARPLVRDDKGHRSLLGRLREAEIVSESKPDRGGRRVYLRKP